MNCKNCGKELKAGAKFCNGCGAAVPTPEKQQFTVPAEQNDTPAKKKTMSHLFIVLAVVGCVALAALCGWFIRATPEKSHTDVEQNVEASGEQVAYEQAVELYADGQYAQALDMFLILDDYRDSKKMTLLCNEQLLEEDYVAATELMNQGLYTEAVEAFSSLNGYKDSAEKSENCKTKILDSQYEEAVAFMEAGNYKAAAGIFEYLHDYRDSAKRLTECLSAMDVPVTVEAWNTISIGDYITFGTYEQDNDRENGKEPIEWLVLDKENTKILVISKYALDCQQYHSVERGDTSWSDCSIRKWLNGDFLQTAFTETERTMIPTVTIENLNNPKYGTEGGQNTQDQIFLISIAEAYKYFVSDQNRQCKRTEYAVSRGITKYDNGCAWWWLRSPGAHENTAAGVYSTGEITLGGDYVSCGTDAVRPAMWINLDTEN